MPTLDIEKRRNREARAAYNLCTISQVGSWGQRMVGAVIVAGIGLVILIPLAYGIFDFVRWWRLWTEN